MNAPFITFEGGEGGGKSTQAARLVERLTALGAPALLTREPGGSPGGEAIRELLLGGAPDRWSDLTESLLFSAARQDHLEKLIRPAREAGRWVVCDRFHLSTRAYQGVDDVRMDRIKALETLILRPDEPECVFLLDIAPEAARARIAGRAGDRFEARPERYHADVRARFLAEAEGAPDRVVVLDAREDPDDLAGAVWSVVRARWPDLIPAETAR